MYRRRKPQLSQKPGFPYHSRLSAQRPSFILSPKDYFCGLKYLSSEWFTFNLNSKEHKIWYNLASLYIDCRKSGSYNTFVSLDPSQSLYFSMSCDNRYVYCHSTHSKSNSLSFLSTPVLSTILNLFKDAIFHQVNHSNYLLAVWILSKLPHLSVVYKIWIKIIPT